MTGLTHADEEGRARMVDIGGKPEAPRTARAEGVITMSREAFDAIRGNALSKGDALSAARIAGIMAAKKTADLIPLCHPLALTDVGVEFELDRSLPGVRARTRASTRGRTGVEMEALTAAAVALLTIYDMAKAIDRGMQISALRLTSKTGGKTGEWKRE